MMIRAWNANRDTAHRFNVNTLHFLVPGDPTTRTGGFIYDMRIVDGLRNAGWKVNVKSLHDTFPFPDAPALTHADKSLSEIPDRALVLVDGLAFGAIPALAHVHRERLNLIALVHHPLAEETGLHRDQRDALARSERAALRCAQRIIVTSPRTATMLHRDYDVTEDRLSVVEPGTDRVRKFHSPRKHEVFRLLCVATVTPRKGHDLLINALARLPGQCWQLRCVGSTSRSPDTVRRLCASIRQTGLHEQVRLCGELDDESLRSCYSWADAFVLPTRLEGYGMALAEAIAHGLPIITTAGGAAADTVGEEAALLIPVDDVDALSDALHRLLNNPLLHTELAAGARRRARQLPSWNDATATMQRVLAQVPPA